MHKFALLMLLITMSGGLLAQVDESSLFLEDALKLEAGAELERMTVGFRCCAGDVGFEEHGDHCVQSVTKIGGEARAVELCQTFHPRCQSYGCTKD